MSRGNKKIIGFDMDGVIIDHTMTKIRVAKKLGYNLKPEQTHTQVIDKVILKEPLLKIKNLIYEHPEVGQSQLLISGAKEVLEKVKGQGIPYYLISRRRTDDSLRTGMKLLKIHNLWPKYFNEKNAFFVPGSDAKAAKAKELGITHYIDDDSEVLMKLKTVKNRFWFDNFNNFKDGKDFIRVTSWEDFEKYIF